MFKKNYKIIIGIIIGIIISSIGVYAAASLSSSEVTYDNNNSGIKAENLQGAIDELYEKTNEQKSKMPKPGNSNIVKVYFYNQEKDSEDFCVTGDEATCKVNTCYLNTSKDSCAPGTIIEYKVKEGEKVKFHVVQDDGEKMILQSQKNTVYNTAWYANSENNSKGPQTILPALEGKTNDWSNVNNLEYSIGEETSTLGFSRCDSYNNCIQKSYELTKEKSSSVKARMITMQEANVLKCTIGEASCPIWMYNYLEHSTSHNGTINDVYIKDTNNSNIAYWIMNTPVYNDRAWYITEGGHLGYNVITITDRGARAVVEINKN